MSSSSQRGDAKFMNYINLFENEDIVIRSPSVAGNQFGVFSKRNLFASNTQKLFLATNPGFFMNNCDLGDFFRRYVFQHNPCDTFFDDGDAESIPIHFESSSFEGLVVGNYGFGHFFNTSHPFSSDSRYRMPNCVVEGKEVIMGNKISSTQLCVYLVKDVEAGTELLWDYHWVLAGITKADVLNGTYAEADFHIGN